MLLTPIREQFDVAHVVISAAVSERHVPLLAQPTHDGALAQLQRLLNVEGYAVLGTEGPLVILDLPLLREQLALVT